MKSLATFTWQQLLEVSGGESVSHHRPFACVALDTDTRTLEAGSFFLPLKGQSFDGNAYIQKAYEQGAQGAFVAADFLEQSPDLKRFPNLIAVPDPLMAYLQLARFHRRRCQAKIVAITGSSGKTTTKEMLYTLLVAALGEEAVQKSEKNFNNEVGVPLTLLNLTEACRVMILEMGMRGLGQIALLSTYAQPDVGIITNVGPAHIGLLKSLENIARAKCEIFTGMDPSATLGIINGDDPLLVDVAGRSWNGCLESFSLHEVDDIHTLPDGGVTFQYEDQVFKLGLPGSHNVMNALAGIKTCEAMGIPLKSICNALAQFTAGGGRWQKVQVDGFENLWVINDAYNANPVSLKVSLEAFMDSRFQGLQKVAVLGGMAELGEYSQQYHHEIGSWMNERGGLDAVVVVGQEARPLADAISPTNIPTFRVEKNSDVVPLVLERWSRDTILFLKASRAFQLEEIPELLKQQVAQSHGVS